MARSLESLTDRFSTSLDSLRAAGFIGPLARLRLIRLLVRTSADRTETARGGATACLSFVPPTAADVVGQYLSGNVLFGIDEGWKWKFYDERFLITPDTARLSRRVRRDVRKAGYEIEIDRDFAAIIRGSADREGSWLTPEAIALYEELHSAGLAASVGCYRDGELVGGLWGFEIGRVFVGMSMFHTADSAGTAALATLVGEVGADRRWDMIDVGVVGPQVTRFGATEFPLSTLQQQLMTTLAAAAAGPASAGQLDDGLDAPAAAAIDSPASP